MDRRYEMNRFIGAFALSAILMLTACSRSVSMDSIRGSWNCEIDGKQVTIEITDDSFTQSAGEVSGEPLKFERNSSGIVVRNSDGRQLMQVNYSQEDDQLYYTIQTPEGDSTYYFTRAAE